MIEIAIDSPLLAEWLQTAFLDDNGEVFLPCGAFGSELDAMLCAVHDRVAVVQHNGHTYAPAPWLAKEHPREARTISTIAASIRARMGLAGRKAGVRNRIIVASTAKNTR